MVQGQNLGLRSKIDEHFQLSILQLYGHEVGYILHKVVGRRASVQQRPFLHLSAEHQGQVRVGASRQPLVPRPALAVVRSSQPLTIRPKKVRIICRAFTPVPGREYFTGSVVKARVGIAGPYFRFGGCASAEGVYPGVDPDERGCVGEDSDGLFVDLELVVAAAVAVDAFVEALVDVNHHDLDAQGTLLETKTKNG